MTGHDRAITRVDGKMTRYERVLGRLAGSTNTSCRIVNTLIFPYWPYCIGVRSDEDPIQHGADVR